MSQDMGTMKIWNIASIIVMFLSQLSHSEIWGRMDSYTDDITIHAIKPVSHHHPDCRVTKIDGEDSFKVTAHISADSPKEYGTVYFAYTSPKEPKVMHAICSVEFRKVPCQLRSGAKFGCYCRDKVDRFFDVVLHESAYAKYNNSKLALILMDQESISLLYSNLMPLPFHIYKHSIEECLSDDQLSRLSKDSGPRLTSLHQLVSVLLLANTL